MPNSHRSTTLVIGAGWLGLPLALTLQSAGWPVSASRRSQAGADSLAAQGLPSVVVDLQAASLPAQLGQVEQLILAFPPGRRAGNAEQYPQQLARLRDALAGSQVRRLLLLSSTGALADVAAELDEQSPTQAASPLAQAEQQLLADRRYQSTVLRLAGLFGPGRYPGRFLAGKTALSRGAAPVNLVHQTDAIGLCQAILEQQAWGHVFHGVAPVSYRRDHFYPAAAQLAGLPAPQFSEYGDGKRVLGGATAERLHYRYQVSDPLAWCQGAASEVKC